MAPVRMVKLVLFLLRVEEAESYLWVNLGSGKKIKKLHMDDKQT